MRTVKSHTYNTFRDACAGLGLLTDDREFIGGLRELSIIASGHYLRDLFVRLLLANTMTNPVNVWEQTWKILADGIVYELRKLHNNPGIVNSLDF